MENQSNELQPLTGQLQNTTSQTQELTLQEQQLFNIISDINMVVNYPYGENEINSWIKTMTRLFPYVTVEVIGKITDDFLKGEIEFIKDYGILNYTKRIPSYSGKLR